MLINTRIPATCITDRLAWTHSHNGQYTVKSGYYQWQKNHIVVAEIRQSRGWSKLWSLQIPHKMRVFLWRFCRNNIPVRYLIRGKGITIPICCPMCPGDVEHVLHLFFDCGFAKECWQIVGLSYNMWTVENAADWLLERLSTDSSEVLSKIATVMWGVWFARNKKIFEEKVMTPAAVMSWSRNQVQDWVVASKHHQTSSSSNSSTLQQNHAWKPPDLGSFKINVDAAVKEGQDFFAIGMALRDYNGHFLAGRVMRFAGSMQVVEAEMVGIVEALSWINHLPVSIVTIESDSQLCVNTIKGSNSNLLEFGNLVHQCKHMISSRGGVLVDFVRKQANRVAHKIAKIPCELNCFLDFMSPPSFLLETIMSDIAMV